MDRKTADKMRAAIEAAVKAAGLEEQFKAEFVTLKGVYDNDAGTYELKVEFRETKINQDEVEFVRNCRRYGFEPSDYGKTFSHQGVTYAFINFNTRAPKFPFVCRNLRTHQKHRFHRDMRDIIAR